MSKKESIQSSIKAISPGRPYLPNINNFQKRSSNILENTLNSNEDQEFSFTDTTPNYNTIGDYGETQFKSEIE